VVFGFSSNFTVTARGCRQISVVVLARFDYLLIARESVTSVPVQNQIIIQKKHTKFRRIHWENKSMWKCLCAGFVLYICTYIYFWGPRLRVVCETFVQIDLIVIFGLSVLFLAVNFAFHEIENVFNLSFAVLWDFVHSFVL